jgi:hypothetical protein
LSVIFACSLFKEASKLIHFSHQPKIPFSPTPSQISVFLILSPSSFNEVLQAFLTKSQQDNARSPYPSSLPQAPSSIRMQALLYLLHQPQESVAFLSLGRIDVHDQLLRLMRRRTVPNRSSIADVHGKQKGAVLPVVGFDDPSCLNGLWIEIGD